MYIYFIVYFIKNFLIIIELNNKKLYNKKIISFFFPFIYNGKINQGNLLTIQEINLLLNK